MWRTRIQKTETAVCGRIVESKINMREDLTILVQNITKTYRLYKNHSDRVKEAFHPFKKKYHTVFDAIKNVSFDVRAGETFGIIGRNGSGKSTLLQIICKIL